MRRRTAPGAVAARWRAALGAVRRAGRPVRTIHFADRTVQVPYAAHSLPGLRLEHHVEQLIPECHGTGYAVISPPERRPLHDGRPYRARGRAHVLRQPAGAEVPAWLHDVDTRAL